MSHHHSHRPEASHSNVERDERAVTKWLNTMEASLADPAHHPFSIKKFSGQEIDAINNYIDSHQKYLARYDQFLPKANVSQSKDFLDFGPCEKRTRS